MTTQTVSADRVRTRSQYRVERPAYVSPEAFRSALEAAKAAGERLQREYAVSGRKAFFNGPCPECGLPALECWGDNDECLAPRRALGQEGTK